MVHFCSNNGKHHSSLIIKGLILLKVDFHSLSKKL